MPIQYVIWKVGTEPGALTVAKLVTEKDLEDMITARSEMFSSGWMLIGREARISFGRRRAEEWRSTVERLKGW